MSGIKTLCLCPACAELMEDAYIVTDAKKPEARLKCDNCGKMKYCRYVYMTERKRR